MRELFTVLLVVGLAASAEAGRWKVGTGPSGAIRRGSCYWDTTETGINQCRYKISNGCVWVQESGSNQCVPGSAPATTATSVFRDTVGNARLTKTVNGLSISKTVEADSEYTLTLVLGTERQSLQVKKTGGGTLYVNGVAQTTNAAGVRALLAQSPAILAYRNYLAGVATNTAYSPAQESYLFDKALLEHLAGDGVALQRYGNQADDRLARAVTLGDTFPSCWDIYMRTVQDAFLYLVTCNWNSWPFLVLTNWGCQWEYFARTQSAWWQFLSCTAIR